VIDVCTTLGRDVLHQRSTERDVENLDAPTDGENGEPAGACLFDERSFGRIARDVYRAYFFVAFLTITRGIDIFSARQHQTGDRIENRRGRLGAGERGNDKWYKPCSFKGSHVSGGEPDTTGIAVWADPSGNSNCAGSNRLARGRHE